MNVLVVIVNYNSADLTIGCLSALHDERAALPGMRVVTTDNSSSDGSVAVLGEFIAKNGWMDWVTLRALERNGGFAYGNNAVIREAMGSSSRPDYVILLNPDTVVRAGAMVALVEFMEGHPAVGIAGSRLEDADGTVQRSAFRFPSIASEFERGIRLGVVTRVLAKCVVAPPPPENEQVCDWVAGASMIVRPAVFERVGLMDEKYFMYFEEVDFCFAAGRAGWGCWYVPGSRVVHLVGAVSQVSDGRKHRKRRPKYWFESRRRYFVKNHGWLYAAGADLAFLVGFAVWRVRRVLEGKRDLDPPRFFRDSIGESVFLRGWG